MNTSVVAAPGDEADRKMQVRGQIVATLGGVCAVGALALLIAGVYWAVPLAFLAAAAAVVGYRYSERKRELYLSTADPDPGD